jgi:hypothetical protein
MLDGVVLPTGLTLLSPGAKLLPWIRFVGRAGERPWHAAGGSDFVGACCIRHPSLDCPTTVAPCPPCQCEPEDGHDHDRRSTPTRHGRVDTHLDVHVAAVVTAVGGVLGTAEFPTTAAGYRRLLGWMCGFGELDRIGVEGTGTSGVSLARHLRAEQVTVVEVMRPNRQVRRRHGKTDVVDAIAAARGCAVRGSQRRSEDP